MQKGLEIKVSKKLAWAVRIFPLTIALLFSLILFLYTFSQYREKVDFLTTKCQQDFVKEQKRKIAALSIDLKMFSKYQNRLLYITIRERINDRLDLARNIIQNTYAINNGESIAKITADIVNIFRNLHHQNSNEYFFLCTSDGIPLVSPQAGDTCEAALAWELGQNDTLLQTDDLVTGQFYREQKLRSWWFREPDIGRSLSSEKAGKIFWFAPLNLLVGTGDYINNIRAAQEQEVFNWIKKVYAKELPRVLVFDRKGVIRFSKGEQIFEGQDIGIAGWYFHDKPLSFSLLGKNKKSGRFVTLVNEKKTITREFYLQILPGWDWVVMTRVDGDRTSPHLQNNLATIRQQNSITLFLLAIACGLIIILVILGTIYVNRKARKFLAEKILYNELTGLPNLSYFLMQAKPVKSNFAFIINIDIDNFSSINERYSRDTGDMLLRQIAARLRSFLPSASLCHANADEFIILLPQQNKEKTGGTHCSTRGKLGELRALFSQPFFLEESQIEVSFSSGCCGKYVEGVSLEELLRRASIALFRAKSEGQNNHICYSAIQEQIERSRQLAETFSHAIDGSDVSVVYQPICLAEEGNTVFRLEALSRWQHPELGAITPQEFIPIAEKNGFMISFSRFLVERICLDLLELKEICGKTPIVSINISSRQLLSADFLDSITSILGKYNIPRSRIILEIKESLLSRDMNTILPMMKTLKNEGLELSLDDFGAGASSLSNLNLIPVRELKIDQSFITGLSTNEESIALVRSIIAIAKANNFRVIGEGVENREQKEWLIQEGCHLMQGFFCVKPLTQEQLLAWYQNKAPFFAEESLTTNLPGKE